MKELRAFRDVLVTAAAYLAICLMLSLILLALCNPYPHPNCPKGYHVHLMLGTTVCASDTR